MVQKKQQTKYNMTVSPLYETAGGNYTSVKVTEEMKEKLATLEVGGKLLVRLRRSAPRSDTDPHAFIEYITPEDVQKAAEARRAREEESL